MEAKAAYTGSRKKTAREHLQSDPEVTEGRRETVRTVRESAVRAVRLTATETVRAVRETAADIETGALR